MSVKRVFVEKKPEYAIKARELREEIESYLDITEVTGVRVLVRYDIENISEDVYKEALGTIFSEPPVDEVFEETFPHGADDVVFSVEYLPGQFDQRADSAEQCVKLLNENEEPVIRSAMTYVISGKLSAEEIAAIKSFCINPVDSREASEEIPIFIVSHVNKDGGIAGPKIMEHIVDTVLYFEGEKQLSYRILRAIKNRFGSTNEIGVFNMDDDGLHEVTNPSEMMLSGRITTVSGSAVVCTIEGTRPILAEVQALVTKSTLSAPRRVATGFDYNRLYMILAVLEKRTGFFFGGVDVYVNIVGGLRLDEPAADLAVALALYSGLCDKVIPEKLMVFGEVGLGGEVRAASHVRERVKEGARLGFERCIIPKQSFSSLSRSENYGIQIIGVRTLEQAFRAINADKEKENKE